MSGEQPDQAPAADYDVDGAVQQALDRLSMLANANDALASTFEVETALRRLARILVPSLADWCAIDLADEQGRLHRTVVAHRDTEGPPLSAFEQELPPVTDGSPAMVAQALRSHTPVLSNDFPRPDPGGDPLALIEQELFTQLGANSAVVCTLRSRGQALGVISLVRIEHAVALEVEDLPLVHDLAHRVALAVDNARLHAQVQQTAERLQRSLLPSLPTTGALDLAARYQPARAGAEVGGDWYDAFMLPEGATALIIGDVAGHDLNAAVRMSQARNMLRGIACDRKEPPGKILARLDAANDILYPGQTMTCIYALVEKQSPDQWWNLHYAVAGHLPPLLITAEGETRFLEEGRSLLLGVDPGRTRPDAFASLPPQCVVLLYTDGLIERRGEDLDRGMARLRRHAAPLARQPLGYMCEELLRALAPDSTDDVALIAVRTPAPHQGPATAAAE
jgi:serine phosphatase RsbU (regulator of sigma subunit)